MRQAMFGMIAATALIVQPALAQKAQVAAQPTPAAAPGECPTQAEQENFEVVALKSQLMVLATTCSSEEAYNAFIQRYKPDLVSAESGFNAWFKQEYGKRAATEHDRYITQLANAQSRVGLAQGTDFCDRNAVMFKEVMALKNGIDLKQYAAGKELLPPAAPACDGGGVATAASTKKAVPAKKK